MNAKPTLRILVLLVSTLVITLAATTLVAAETGKPVKALLVTGGCCHDYTHQKKILTEGISARANVEWIIVHEGDGKLDHRISIYEKPDWSKGYDIVVHDECFAEVKDEAFVENILKPHREGLPAVNLHCTMHCYRVSFEKYTGWFEFTGVDTRRHGAQLPIAITYAKPEHEITKGFEDWTTIKEELYQVLKTWDTVTPLAQGAQGNDKNLLIWVNNYHGTRVFSTTLGHNNETVGDPKYLDLVTRGLLWAVKRPDAAIKH
jgi:type 1 glutamine amidotransferase